LSFSLSIITSPENFEGEQAFIERMFEFGLETLFVRKPNLSKNLIEQWLLGINCKWRKKILPWQGSAHSFEELRKMGNMEIVLLGPVFDSISKRGYKSKFSKEELKAGIAEWRRFIGDGSKKLYALGGVNAKNIGELKEMGFDGAAVLGGVWNYADPAATFESILSAML
jgi:thiamine-phosphate pyrophosphorylase